MRQNLIELQELDISTIIVEDFNIPFPGIDRSSREKISTDTADLKTLSITLI